MCDMQKRVDYSQLVSITRFDTNKMECFSRVEIANDQCVAS